MNFNVFISYSTHDLGQVELLRQQLVDAPIEVFVAEHSVEPSQSLGEKITKAIAGCDLFVVLWSSNAEASKWVSQEIGYAKALNKQILPLVLNEGMELPGFIGDLKYLPTHKDTKSALRKARETIINGYKSKTEALAAQAAKKQKEKEQLFLVGAGIFLAWAFSK